MRRDPTVFGLEFNRNQKLALYVLIGLCVIGVSYSHIASSRSRSSEEIVLRENGPEQGVQVEAADSDRPPTLSELRNAGKVVCHVTGCVKKPGVYTLQNGQRVVDAIHAAGGPKSDADLQTLNLAARVEDGSRIELPSVQETRQRLAGALLSHVPKGSSTGRRSTSPTGKLVAPGEGVVHINSAAAEELQRLPGVGPATAEKIIEYRRTSGGFSRPEQIMDVKGIGPKKYEKMRPFVAL